MKRPRFATMTRIAEWMLRPPTNPSRQTSARSVGLCTLPDAVRGNSLINDILAGHLNAAKLARQCPIITASLTVRPAFGTTKARPTSRNGQQLGGSCKNPLNSSDMSSFLLQAQSSKAQVIALANGGSDTVNAVRQAQEFGIQKGGQDVVAIIGFLTDIHAMGLPTAQGLILTTPSYWDLDDKSRAFSERFYKAIGRMPSAGRLFRDAGLPECSAEGRIRRRRQGNCRNEGQANQRYVRSRRLHSKGRAFDPRRLSCEGQNARSIQTTVDYLEILATIPGEKAFRPLADSRCPLIK